MANSDNFFTLVVHTPARADRLKEILEFHGVKVSLADFQGDSSAKIQAKAVRIPLADLELGLKILESGQTASSPFSFMKISGMGNSLLIPVDFSPSSMVSVKIGFFLARKLNVEPIILHAYLAPVFPSEPFGEDLENPGMPVMEEDMQSELDFREVNAARLAKFKKQVLDSQKAGEIPDIHFSTTLLEGIPEQVIHEYCRDNKPVMVVMATRGIHKKETDLVGSVTAEVIDACRVPVFTVPEGCSSISMASVKNVLFFCTLTADDVVNMRGLMKMGDYPAANVFLMPVTDSPFRNVHARIEDVANIFTQSYPTASFHAESHLDGKFEEALKSFLDSHKIDLIIVPNKKSTAFSRFFRPTLAHKILFERDIPLLVLPV